MGLSAPPIGADRTPFGPRVVFRLCSNMHESAFLERRGMRPLDSRIGRLEVIGCGSISKEAKGKAAPANICPDASAEVWGVLYQITGREMLRLNATEGVPAGDIARIG